jgi:uncharacterized UPF0160 family protein
MPCNLFVVNTNRRINAVPVKCGSFGDRLSLPEEWRGLRDEELSTKAGIKDCTFIHRSGFTGGNASYEGVLAMAVEALRIGEAL